MPYRVDAYNCHKCHARHAVDNMVAYCAACYSGRDTETALLIDGLREEIKRLRAVVDAARNVTRWAEHSGSAVDHNDCHRCRVETALERLDKGA